MTAQPVTKDLARDALGDLLRHAVKTVRITDVETAVRAGKIDYEGAGQLLRFYEDGLRGYTYLEG